MGISDTYSDVYELDQRHKPFPTFETVVWNIDGTEVQVDNDWSATATDRGGFDEALIRVLDSDRLPRGVMRGMTLTAYEKGSGEVVWEGTVDGEPQVRGLALEVRGRGNKSLLTDQETPRLYSTRDVSLFHDGHDQPHDFATTADTDKIEAEIKPASLFFKLEKDNPYAQFDKHVLAAWLPGTTIAGYAFDYRKSGSNAARDLRTESFTGPQGTRTLVADHTLGAGGGADDTWLSIAQTIATPEDGMTLGPRFNAANTPTTWTRIRIKNLRLYGISTDDTMYPSEVMADIGAAVGLDTARVELLAVNVLPLYWQAAWSELADYMADLTDRHWGVYENSSLEFADYTSEWTCAAEAGATVIRCDPIPPFSGILVSYPDLSGDTLFYELNASPNPNEDEGITPQAEFEIEDPQHIDTLAGVVAGWNLEYLTGERWDLEVLVTFARQNGVPVSPYRIRPGGLVTVRDCHPMGSATDRIRSVRYTAFGTEVFCNSNANLAAEIAELGIFAHKDHRRKRPRRRKRHRRPRV